MAMDDTTLHTFLFHCPAALRTLVLLGSWDNFSRPYSLELDARRGRSFWKGCFTFSDIICDGDFGHHSAKRNGLLKMGGTYWYFYKVDEDDECHNPSEPSTTVCPLLPGQRLNVLEIPRERHSRSTSDTPAFTRNPKDRYLTPVPPSPLRPLPSPRLGGLSPDPYSIPLASPWTPRSATYPPADRFLSPNVVRHARSASASPHMPSTPLFPDFRVLKEKLASKRSASRTRSASNARDLEIGSPVLISSTVEDLNLIPLSVYQAPPVPSPDVTPITHTKISRSLPSIQRDFSPLGSHPVDPVLESVCSIAELPSDQGLALRRRRSHIPSTVITSEFKLGQGRIRANSADTRRTQHYLFSNDPWLSSPKLQEEFEEQDQVVEDDTPPAPTLRRQASYLNMFTASERPTSSHGSDCDQSLQSSSLDKDVPAPPQYLTPAPLFAYNSPHVDDVIIEELGQDEREVENMGYRDHVVVKQFHNNARSHFSTWSSDSFAYSCPTSDDDAVLSPTFSSLASDCSSPQPHSTHYSFVEQTDASKRPTAIYESEDDAAAEEEAHTTYLSSTPPQLDDLRISTFGADLFSRDIHITNTAPRRQATCFGLGFQYSLPDDELTSKTTVTDCTLQREPTITGQRESSVSQLNTLMADFAFLGDAVI